MAGKDSDSFGIGFFAGLLAGIAIGFLYAPSPGKDTREKIRGKADEIKEMASERIEQTREAAAEAGKKVREKLGNQDCS